MGEENLGFGKDDVGLHSIRSGGAMAMFLSFLEYIRDQVETFTLHVSKNMIQYEQFFNLKDDGKRNSTHIPFEDTNSDSENKDGPDSVPFCVKFNDLALNGEE